MSPPTSPLPDRPWYADPLERDRYLDGEGSPAERAARAAELERDLERDPAQAAALASRAAFLQALARARTPARVASPELETRVRALLAREAEGVPESMHESVPEGWAAASRPRGRMRRLAPWLTAAAVLLVALGTWSGLPWSGLGGREAQALSPAELAASLLDWRPQGLEEPAGCAGGPGEAVHAFVLVQRGELEIRACPPGRQTEGTTTAVLRRPEELPVVGYVAVPAPGTAWSSEVGVTEVGDGKVVVFDVLDHGRRVYLAIDSATLRLKHAGAGDRWTCAACHGPQRQALPNPHRIVLRRAP